MRHLFSNNSLSDAQSLSATGYAYHQRKPVNFQPKFVFRQPITNRAIRDPLLRGYLLLRITFCERHGSRALFLCPLKTGRHTETITALKELFAGLRLDDRAIIATTREGVGASSRIFQVHFLLRRKQHWQDPEYPDSHIPVKPARDNSGRNSPQNGDSARWRAP